MIDQLTVFLPNEPGRLAAMAGVLGDAGIQMHGLMVSDADDMGIARVVCDTPRRAAQVLAASGYRAAITPVLAIEVDDVPGGLASVLDGLAGARVNIEYAYCTSIGGRTVDVLKVTGEPLGVRLAQAGLHGLEPAEVYRPDEG